VVADTALDLARWQFAATTLYHFIFVPLTLGLVPIVAIMQTLWYRNRDEKWLRLTRFFGTLMLINFAIGVATGIVQEFQFGMNWSAFSRVVGDVFGSPLAIEGLGAFFLESTFLGLWIFGWNKLSPKLHLAVIYLVWAGTWLSAFFILAANSWMQHPVGYKVDEATGHAQATDIFEILFQKFTWFAVGHALLAGVMTAGFLVLGVSIWQMRRGRDAPIFRAAAKLAIIIVVPVSAVNLMVGSEFGVEITNVQPMKIAAAEALWDTEQPAGFTLFQIGGWTEDDQDPSFNISIPRALSFLATNSFDGKVVGMNELQSQYEQKYGPGDYIPNVPLVFWSMRVMAYLGTLSLLLALWAAYLLRKDRLAESKWFGRAAVAGIAFPYLSSLAGWVLSEAGRQPWVAFGLLKTEDAVSPTTSVGMVAASLTIFVALYGSLAVVDFILMRKYARLDLPSAEPPSGDHGDHAPAAAAGY
jgi:cytochrome bd ubiquinol oxidase subunit I